MKKDSGVGIVKILILVIVGVLFYNLFVASGGAQVSVPAVSLRPVSTVPGLTPVEEMAYAFCKKMNDDPGFMLLVSFIGVVGIIFLAKMVSSGWHSK